MSNRIIAEIGSVHDGSFGNARKLIEESAKGGADTVKFQLHVFEEESLSSAPNPPYFMDETRKDYFNRIAFTKQQWADLKKISEDLGLEFLVSPFSIRAVEILEDIEVSEYKVASGEVSNLPLLETLSKTRKPVIISSGMSNWSELDAAVAVFRNNCKTTILQCSSLYPCPSENVGLNVIKEMKERYRVDVGFSDHTLGFSASVAAAAIGATTIEKHVTFSKSMYGSDARHSMEFREFKLFCTMINEVWGMNECIVNKNDSGLYQDTKKIFEKSIVASADFEKDTVLDCSMMNFKKPSDGIPARQYKDLIGKKLLAPVKKDHAFSLEDFYE